MTPLFDARFDAPAGYLSACTAGLPLAETTEAMHAFIDEWATGRLDAVALGAQLEQVREAFARIAGVSQRSVAIGSQTSQLASVVATGVPDGGEVLAVTGDFASITHPFEQLAGRGVRVRYAPLSELADAITGDTDLVAFSLVQSATGEIADHERIIERARRVGARTLADLTQSLGWYPVGAESFDFTICHAYKWLCAPRGIAFLTVTDERIADLTPIAAGWYSADDVWSSCYAGYTPLADGAGRFDVSPVWPAIGGTLAALSFFARSDITEIAAHNRRLANAARALLGIEPSPSAIVSWPDPAGTALRAMHAHGIVASGRAGRARIAFHIWNTDADIALLEEALADAP